jgi:hypothetical protein
MNRKIASFTGIIGTTLFTLSFTINGCFQPGYNPVQNYISELAIWSLGWIQIVSFLILGVSIIFFSFGIRGTFHTGKASQAASFLFLAIGICYILSGLFVTDPQAMFDNQQTLHGIIHGIAGALVFSLSAISCFVLWWIFRIDKEWKPLSAFSFLAGVAMTILIVLMKMGQLQSGVLHDWAGAVQRCCLMFSYVLIFRISCKMRKVS